MKNILLFSVCLLLSMNIIGQCNFSITYTQTDYQCSGGASTGGSFAPILGTITLNAQNGIPPYQYKLNNGSFQNTNFFDNLNPTTYTLFVQDASNCTDSVLVTINQPPQPSITNTSTTPSSCIPGCDGTMTVLATGGTPPYQYAIAYTQFGPQLQLSNQFNSVCAGAYTVTLVDSNGCSAQTTTQLTTPNALPISILTSTNPTCNPGCDGIATFTSSGGNGINYTISSGGQIGQNGVATGLCAGTPYMIIVTDANGCTSSTSITLTGNVPYIPISITNIIQPSCSPGCDGEVTVNAGTGFNYTISPGGQIGPNGVATGLCAGTPYMITVVDANGCSSSTSFTMISNGIMPPISISSVINPTCTFGNDGAIVIAGMSSTPNIYYYISPSTGYYSYDTIKGLSASNYTITATDFNNCFTTTVVHLQYSSTITNLNTTNPTCLNACNGTVTFTGINSTNFTLIRNSPYLVTNSTTGIFANLCAGQYTCISSDANGCSSSTITNLTSTFTIDSATIIEKSCGICNGEISLHTSGGQVPYSFTINNTSNNSSNFTNLCAGNYTIQVSDASNCTLSYYYFINEPNSPISNSEILAYPNCNTNSQGMIHVVSSGGTPPYNHSIFPSAPFLGTDSSIFKDLSTGSYTIVTNDKNQCKDTIYSSLFYQINYIDSVQSVPETCIPGNNGQLIVYTQPSPNFLFYSIDHINWSPTNYFTSLPQGSYTVYINNKFGCEDSMLISIYYIENLPFNISQVQNASCFNSATGSISISNDSSNYILLSGQISLPSNRIFNNLHAGNYLLSVTNSIGCKSDTLINISEPVALESNIFNTYSTYGDCHGKLNIISQGGTAPYTYQIEPNNFSTQTDSSQFDFLCNTTYTITTTDAHGCTSTHSIFIPFKEILSDEFALYPNPINNEFTLIFNRLIDVRISCYSLFGQRILDENFLQQDKIQIQTSSFANGIYCLELRFDDQRIIKKIEILH